jgi:Domain of unknown function DUF1828
MIEQSEIERRVQGHGLVRRVDTLPKGHVRIETAFLYPDGSSVDVFLVDDAPLFAPRKLSDFGQTTSWLLDVQVRPWLSKKRQRFVEDALRIYGVEQHGGALEFSLESLDRLTDGLVKLGQACVRVADLSYTRRSSFTTAITEELEEFIGDSELEFDVNKELVGRHGSPVRVDFLVHGQRTSSALLTLASGSASQAHVAANEIFRRWYDLNSPERGEQRITVLDDRHDVYRDDDIARLKDLSDVVAFSDRQTLRDLLAA